jgi:uncharacterized membrane protein
VISSDESLDRLEQRLGVLLKTGVLSSAACLAFGLIAWFAVGQTAVSAAALTVGLMLLMATPIMRVVVSLVAYLRMRDWFFVGTTVTVFILLAITVVIAWTKIRPGA